MVAGGSTLRHAREPSRRTTQADSGIDGANLTMIRNIAQVTVLFLLVLVAMGFSTLSCYATGIASHTGSMTIITSQTTGEDSGVEIFTVLVSSHGFNGSANTLNLDVSQGDQVDITFVYSDPTVNTAHQIALEGYNIRTSVIDQANPITKI